MGVGRRLRWVPEWWSGCVALQLPAPGSQGLSDLVARLLLSDEAVAQTPSSVIRTEVDAF